MGDTLSHRQDKQHIRGSTASERKKTPLQAKCSYCFKTVAVPQGKHHLLARCPHCREEFQVVSEETSRLAQEYLRSIARQVPD